MTSFAYIFACSFTMLHLSPTEIVESEIELHTSGAGLWGAKMKSMTFFEITILDFKKYYFLKKIMEIFNCF